VRWSRAARVEEVPRGGLLSVEVEGRRFVLTRLAGGVRAFVDRCSHEAARISEGFIEDDEVECPLHGARFDLDTGLPRSLPAVKGLEPVAALVDAGEVFLAIVAQGPRAAPASAGEGNEPVPATRVEPVATRSWAGVIDTESR
jgi:nitrite reductase/ring-hydroxylating ferredoxin subunit